MAHFGLVLDSAFTQILRISLRLGVYAVIFAAVAVGFAGAQGLPVAAPQTVGMNAEKLRQIDELAAAEIAAKHFPGAVVLVGHKGKIVFRKAYGNRSLVPTVEPMTVDTIFDLASLTKVVATTTSVMILVEQGKLRLSDTIGKYIPEIQDERVKRVTIQQLMTHVSGFAPDFDLREKWTGREGMLQALYKEKLRTPAGTKFVYSDINYITLGEIVGRITRRQPDYFFWDAVSARMEMWTTGYARKTRSSGTSAGWMFTGDDQFAVSQKRPGPINDWFDRVAPTENIRGQNSYLGSKFEGNDATGDQILRGQVHDPTAYRMDGVAGHAGLFSTADDLARFCQMLLNGGVVPASQGRDANGSERLRRGSHSTLDTLPTGRVSASGPVRILSAQTVAKMTAPIVVSESGETRGLGWDINTGFSSNRGDLFPLGSFGHTGFTGTSIWIDPVSQTFVVILTNRVHPDGKGDSGPIRAKVATVVASAIEDTPAEKYKQAEAEYNAAVAAQIPRFKELVARSTQAASSAATTTGDTPAAPDSGVTVLNGIDILERDKFKQLDGMKIGLVTNHTGRDIAGRQTIDILKEAPNVKLVSLFSPEHGIRGLADEKVGDSVDEKTGLPVYSLYGETRRPKPEQLKDLDAIVYDIQDIGTRFYTYTATLRNVLEEAAKFGKPVFVLDRPDPINGVSVDGPIADEDKLSFTAAHTIPVRYGMTIGELGTMMNAERKIGADLRVIKMEGWARSMWFDETGQTWINPSPNMRSLNEATLYPGIGLLEVTNVSVGRGTDTPFEVVGAPWIDGRQLAAYLNAQGMRGVRFVPIRFTPSASVFKGEDCSGVNMIVTARNAFNSIRTGFEIAAALRKFYPNDWQADKYLRLLANQATLNSVKNGDDAAKIESTGKSGTVDFVRRRALYLLYK